MQIASLSSRSIVCSVSGSAFSSFLVCVGGGLLLFCFDLCFELVYNNFECVNPSKVTLFGGRQRQNPVTDQLPVSVPCCFVKPLSIAL